MTAVDDLVAWLTAQLDADAQRAQTALAGRDGVWRYIETSGGEHRVLDSLGYEVVEHSAVESEPWFTLPHVAEWGPARVLRDIDAKRGLLAEHAVRDGRCRVCAAHANGNWTRFRAPCLTLRLLASVYSDRDGYQESWRP